MKKVLFFCLLFVFSSVILAKERPSKKFKIKPAPLELESFALSLQDYMTAKDHVFSRSVHYDVLFERIIQRDAKPQTKLDRQALTFKQMLFAQIQVSMPKKIQAGMLIADQWRYLHHRVYKRRHFLSFHADYTDADDYLELEVEKISGQWWIVDWYAYSSDHWASDSLYQMYQLFLSSDDFESISNYILSISKAENSRKLGEAFASLPPIIRSSDFMLSFTLKHLMALKDENYMETLGQFFPLTADSDFHLAKLGYFLPLGKYQEALKHLNAAEQAIGGDVNFELLRAELYGYLGNKNKMLKSIQRAISDDHNLQLVYSTAVVLFVQSQLHELAIQALDVLREDYGFIVNKEDMAKIDGMEAFAESPLFLAWLAQSR